MGKQILHYIGYLIFLLIILGTSLVVSGKIKINTDIGETHISINQHKLSGIQLGDFHPISGNNYSFTIIEESKNVAGDWIAFLGILTTLLAAFFIYSSWKIDSDLRSITNIKESMRKIEEQAGEEMEFSAQLKYSIHYMLSKEYEKAIDALIVLKSESYTIKEQRNYNIVVYFLAICFYESGLQNNDIEKISKAVEFINRAIEDPTHPLKNEIISKYNEIVEINNGH